MFEDELLTMLIITLLDTVHNHWHDFKGQVTSLKSKDAFFLQQVVPLINVTHWVDRMHHLDSVIPF